MLVAVAAQQSTLASERPEARRVSTRFLSEAAGVQQPSRRRDGYLAARGACDGERQLLLLLEVVDLGRQIVPPDRDAEQELPFTKRRRHGSLTETHARRDPRGSACCGSSAS